MGPEQSIDVANKQTNKAFDDITQINWGHLGLGVLVS